jgi:hypothetical protein
MKKVDYFQNINGGNNTNKQIFIFVIIIIIFLSAVSSGCFENDNGDGKKKKSHDYKIGDTWTYKLTAEDNPEIIRTLTVTDIPQLFNNRETLAVAIYELHKEYVFGEDDEYPITFGESKLTGYTYNDMNNFQMIHSETEMIGKVKFSTEEWQEYKWEYIYDFQYTGNYPENYKVGDTWIITEKIFSESKSWWDSEPQDPDISTVNQTKNYEVLGKSSVTVQAGTFDCYEIKVEVLEQEDEYTIEYHSLKVKGKVKEVHYSGSDIYGITELIAFNVS